MAKLSGKEKARSRERERLDKEKKYLTKKTELRNSILKFDHPKLKEKCDPVSVTEVADIFKKLTSVIKTVDNGVGLAASQIGITKTMFIIRPDPKSGIIKAVVNPEILEHSSETNTDHQEGCLSYPGVFCYVPRWNFIKISYHTEQWEKREEIFTGWEARIVQHEIDHCLGVCLVGNEWRIRNGQ